MLKITTAENKNQRKFALIIWLGDLMPEKQFTSGCFRISLRLVDDRYKDNVTDKVAFLFSTSSLDYKTNYD